MARIATVFLHENPAHGYCPMISGLSKPALRAEALALAFVAAIAALAFHSGVLLFLFPELAALSHDVFTRPRGRWAQQPVRIVLTPVLTGVVGLFVSRHFAYGVLPVCLIVSASLVILLLLRSQIAPAFSAGLLPLALHETEWMYPVAILVGLLALVLLLRLWQAVALAAQPEGNALEDALEELPHSRIGLGHMGAFVVLLALLGQWTGHTLILFPPLVVMSYEAFGHPEVPGWLRYPPLFPLVCVLAALAGTGTVRLLGPGVPGVVLTLAFSMLLLHLSRLHMPPVLAIGLIPYILPHADFWYPLAVAMGTGTLMVWYLLRRQLQPVAG